MKKFHVGIMALVLLFVFAGCGDDGEKVFVGKGALGQISGVLFDTVTLEPLADVTATLTGSGDTTVTDDNGAFFFADVEPGVQELTFVKDGYRFTSRNVYVDPQLYLNSDPFMEAEIIKTHLENAKINFNFNFDGLDAVTTMGDFVWTTDSELRPAADFMVTKEKLNYTYSEFISLNVIGIVPLSGSITGKISVFSVTEAEYQNIALGAAPIAPAANVEVFFQDGEDVNLGEGAAAERGWFGPFVTGANGTFTATGLPVGVDLIMSINSFAQDGIFYDGNELRNYDSGNALSDALDANSRTFIALPSNNATNIGDFYLLASTDFITVTSVAYDVAANNFATRDGSIVLTFSKAVNPAGFEVTIDGVTDNIMGSDDFDELRYSFNATFTQVTITNAGGFPYSINESSPSGVINNIGGTANIISSDTSDIGIAIFTEQGPVITGITYNAADYATRNGSIVITYSKAIDPTSYDIDLTDGIVDLNNAGSDDFDGIVFSFNSTFTQVTITQDSGFPYSVNSSVPITVIPCESGVRWNVFTEEGPALVAVAYDTDGRATRNGSIVLTFNKAIDPAGFEVTIDEDNIVGSITDFGRLAYNWNPTFTIVTITQPGGFPYSDDPLTPTGTIDAITNAAGDDIAVPSRLANIFTEEGLKVTNVELVQTAPARAIISTAEAVGITFNKTIADSATFTSNNENAHWVFGATNNIVTVFIDNNVGEIGMDVRCAADLGMNLVSTTVLEDWFGAAGGLTRPDFARPLTLFATNFDKPIPVGGIGGRTPSLQFTFDTEVPDGAFIVVDNFGGTLEGSWVGTPSVDEINRKIVLLPFNIRLDMDKEGYSFDLEIFTNEDKTVTLFEKQGFDFDTAKSPKFAGSISELIVPNPAGDAVLSGVGGMTITGSVHRNVQYFIILDEATPWAGGSFRATDSTNSVRFVFSRPTSNVIAFIVQAEDADVDENSGTLYTLTRATTATAADSGIPGIFDGNDLLEMTVTVLR